MEEKMISNIQRISLTMAELVQEQMRKEGILLTITPIHWRDPVSMRDQGSIGCVDFQADLDNSWKQVTFTAFVPHQLRYGDPVDRKTITVVHQLCLAMASHFRRWWYAQPESVQEDPDGKSS